jgi:hypothetical protein
MLQDGVVGTTLFVDVVLDSSAIYRLHVSLTGQDLADGYIHSNAIGKVSFALTTWLSDLNYVSIITLLQAEIFLS